MNNTIDIFFVDDVNVSTHPFTEMAVARAQFEQMGYSTFIHFLPRFSESAILDIFAQRKPGYVLGTFDYSGTHDMLDILKFIKHNYENVKICIASQLVDIYAKNFLQDYSFIDLAIVGEVNETGLELFEYLQNNRSLESCKGIVYRDKDNNVIETELREYVDNINIFPIADRRHQKAFKLEYIEILKNRGCNGTCTFCNHHAFRSRQSENYFRTRDAKSVVDEIEQIYNYYNGLHYKFFMGDFCLLDGTPEQRDDLFVFADEIIKRKFKIVIHFQTRAELITAETIPLLERLKESGAVSVLIGAESAAKEDLELYGKIAKTEDYLRALEIFNHLGMAVFPSFIVFNHLTDAKRLKTNFDFLHKYGYGKTFDWYRSNLLIHPETPIVQNLINEGVLKKDYNYLNIRQEAKWKHKYVKNLLDAFLSFKISPTTHRNQIRVNRLKHVLKNRFSEEIIKSFSEIINSSDKLSDKMNEENYILAVNSLNLAENGASTEEIIKAFPPVSFDFYEKEFEHLKMLMEVKFERVRKYIDII